jgi:hypothetical protein
MPVHSLNAALVTYAKAVRAALAAGPTNPELALAPEFKRLVEDGLRAIYGQSAPLPTVLPEYTKASVGRPDLAFKRPGQPPRAFIELKEPAKSVEPSHLRGHDKAQFGRFCSLPTWALSNFHNIALSRRDELQAEAIVVPRIALAASTADGKAEQLIAAHSASDFSDILERLALAQPQMPGTAQEIAASIAHAARLVRDIAVARLRELAVAGMVGTPLQLVAMSSVRSFMRTQRRAGTMTLTLIACLGRHLRKRSRSGSCW